MDKKKKKISAKAQNAKYGLKLYEKARILALHVENFEQIRKSSETKKSHCPGRCMCANWLSEYIGATALRKAEGPELFHDI